jgi:hypothetical protein
MMPTTIQLIDASIALIDELDSTPLGNVSDKLDKLSAMLIRAKYAMPLASCQDNLSEPDLDKLNAVTEVAMNGAQG